MVAFKLPGREFKGLLNIAREKTKYVYGINLPQFLKKLSSCLNFLKHNYTVQFQIKVNIYIPIINVSFVDL